MTTFAPFTLQTGLFFRRKLLETLRQPVWIITGLTTPALYLALFAPLLRSLDGGPAFPPGHVLDGDRRHFMLTGCNDCCARTVLTMTLEQVERWYQYGAVSQDVYEAFCHAWATSAPRYSSAWDSWKRSPAIPEVVRLVAVMRGTMALKVTAKRKGTS